MGLTLRGGLRIKDGDGKSARKKEDRNAVEALLDSSCGMRNPSEIVH